MKLLASTALFAFCALSFAQGHDVRPADAMANISFLKGNWVGKQDFVTGGDPMVGDATNSIDFAIGNRYLEEKLSTTLPGRTPSDTRHFITYDPKSATYKAWWFNDSSVGAMELEGALEGKKLTLTSKPTKTAQSPTTVFRATYDGSETDKLVYKLEIQQGEKWQALFMTTYVKKS